MSVRKPIEPLSDAGREAALRDLPAWDYEDDRAAITRTFHFADFRKAFDWMSKVAEIAERDDHHPEWTNIYGTVIVRLTTHECDGVSERDVKMAAEMERLLS